MLDKLRLFSDEEFEENSLHNMQSDKFKQINEAVQSFVSKNNSEKVLLIAGEGVESKSVIGETIFRDVIDQFESHKFLPLYFKFKHRTDSVKRIPERCLGDIGYDESKIEELKSSGQYLLIIDHYSTLGRLVNLWVSSKLYEWKYIKLICICEKQFIEDKKNYKHFFAPINQERCSLPMLSELKMDLIKTTFERKNKTRIKKELKIVEKKTLSLTESLEKHPLNGKLFVGSAMIQFWVDSVRRGGVDSKHVLDLCWCFIESSKKNKKLSIAASNAMTILVKCGVNFSGKDLKRISVPHADMSGGYFDTSDLSGADLSHVNMKNIWLRKAILLDCNMSDVSFEAFPIFLHKNKISAMDYREDLNMLLTACNEKLFLWNSETYECQIIEGLAGDITSIATSRSGKTVVVGYKNGMLSFINLNNKKQRNLAGHAEEILGVFFYKSEKYIISGGRDNTIRVWDLYSGDSKKIYKIDGSLKCLTVSSRGIQAVYMDLDKGVYLWSEKEPPKKLPILLTTISSAYIGISDFRLWNDDLKGKEFSGLNYDISCAAFSTDGKHFAFGGVDGGVSIINLNTNERVDFQFHTLVVNTLCFSQDGRYLVTASADNITNVWDINNVGKKVINNDLGSVNCISVSADNKKIIMADTEGVKVVGMGVSHPQKDNLHDGVVNAVVFSKKGTQIFSGGADAKLLKWNTQGAQPRLFFRHESDITSLSICANDKRIISATKDGVVSVMDAASGCIIKKTKYKNTINAVDISSDGKVVVAGFGVIYVWNLKLNDEFELLVDKSEVLCVSISPDGNLLASGDFNKSVRIWDLQSKKEILCKSDHQWPVNCVAFSSDGQFVASGSTEDNLHIWNLKTETFVRINFSNAMGMPGHWSTVESVKFINDDRYIITGNQNATVKIWDLDKSKCVSIIQVRHRITDMDYHDETGKLLIGTRDGLIQVFQQQNRTNDSWLSVSGIFAGLQKAFLGDDQETNSWLPTWFSDHSNRQLFLDGCDTRGSKQLSWTNYLLLQQSGARVDFNRKQKPKEESNRSLYDYFEQDRLLQSPEKRGAIRVDDDVHEYMLNLDEQLEPHKRKEPLNYTAYENYKGQIDLDSLRKEVEEARLIDKYVSEMAGDIFLHYKIANKLYRLGYMDQLVNCYLKLIELKVSDAGLYHNLACCYHALGEVKLAKNYFQKCIELKSYSGVHCEYGLFLYCQERYDDAVKECLQAIELHNDPSGLSFGKIEQFRLTPCLSEEINKQEIITIKPLYLAYYYLILSYQCLDDHVSLETSLSAFKVIVEGQDDALIYRLLGDLYVRMDDKDTADDYFGLALSLETVLTLEHEEEASGAFVLN